MAEKASGLTPKCARNRQRLVAIISTKAHGPLAIYLAVVVVPGHGVEHGAVPQPVLFRTRQLPPAALPDFMPPIPSRGERRPAPSPVIVVIQANPPFLFHRHFYSQFSTKFYATQSNKSIFLSPGTNSTQSYTNPNTNKRHEKRTPFQHDQHPVSRLTQVDCTCSLQPIHRSHQEQSPITDTIVRDRNSLLFSTSVQRPFFCFNLRT
jgi:hypothetical protein